MIGILCDAIVRSEGAAACSVLVTSPAPTFADISNPKWRCHPLVHSAVQSECEPTFGRTHQLHLQGRKSAEQEKIVREHERCAPHLQQPAPSAQRDVRHGGAIT
jgi:hypothetical protein